MQLLGPVIDIYQQQIVKEQVLDEIILIKALLVSHQKVLDLKCRQLPNHICVVTASLDKQNIL